MARIWKLKVAPFLQIQSHVFINRPMITYRPTYHPQTLLGRLYSAATSSARDVQSQPPLSIDLINIMEHKLSAIENRYSHLQAILSQVLCVFTLFPSLLPSVRLNSWLIFFGMLWKIAGRLAGGIFHRQQRAKEAPTYHGCCVWIKKETEGAFSNSLLQCTPDSTVELYHFLIFGRRLRV